MTDEKAEEDAGQAEQNLKVDLLEPLRTPELKEPIEEMIELMSQSARAFLLGAGCSKCAGLPLMAELTNQVLGEIPGEDDASFVLKGVLSNFDGSKTATIEDYMSELVDHVSVAARREQKGATERTIEISERGFSAEELQKALIRIKQAIGNSIASSSVRIDTHRQFVRAMHSRLESGKAISQAPVDYFTLNYDTLIEDALALERVHALDGFQGGATGWWTPSAYSDSAAKARVFKVHGSIDWCHVEGDVLPRRIRQGLEASEGTEHVLIWPAATKYRESQRDPFAQILSMLRESLRPPKSSEVVLGVIGYSFGDSHINHELDRALREAEGRLTILVFTEQNEPEGLIETWLNDSAVAEHVRVHANRGFFHGDDARPSSVDLPWWRFEVLASLLGGDR